MFRFLCPPHPSLRNYISHYLVVEISVVEKNDGILCSFPDGASVMNVFYSPDIPDFVFKSKKLENMRACVSGIFEKGIKVFKPGKYKSVITFFTPTGVWDLFGIPPSEYLDTLISLDQVVSRNESNEIVEQVNTAENTFGRIHCLNEFFKRYAEKHRVKKNIFQTITNEFVHRNGVVKIHEMTQVFEMSGRQIDRLFNHHFGVTPKHYLKLIRLGAAYKMLLTNPKISVQDVIFAMGYYDQAHMIHNFTWYSDIKPYDLQKRSEKTIFPSILCIPERDWEKYKKPLLFGD